MARRKESKRQIVLALRAHATLRQIWAWNAGQRGERHADSYENFLFGRIERLSKLPELGEALADFPDVRRLLVQRRGGGYGHLVFYRVQVETIEVLVIYHTAQDWQSYIEEDIR